MEPLKEPLINGGKRDENKILGQCKATSLNLQRHYQTGNAGGDAFKPSLLWLFFWKKKKYWICLLHLKTATAAQFISG